METADRLGGRRRKDGSRCRVGNGQGTRPKLAEKQKQAGADQIGGVARAVHGAAREIEQNMPQAAGFIHDAATRLEGAAASLRERSVDDLMRSLNDFARTQPAAFFGGAVLAGFALSRFLKSSASPSNERQS